MRPSLEFSLPGACLLLGGLLVAACAPSKTARETASVPDSTTNAATGGDSTSMSRSTSAAPSAERLGELAHRVVTTSIRTRPGDVVVIDGGKHTIELMEAMAIEAAKAGGMPNLWLESDKLTRTMLSDIPDEYIEQKPRYLANWYQHTNVWIGLGAFEDPKSVFAGVPEAKLAKFAAAGQVITGMLNASPIRGAFIDYPTTGRASENGLPFDRYAKMQWAAIGTDYTPIAAEAKAIGAMLRGAKQVHITSPNGTDVRFAVGQRQVIISAGILSPNAAKETLLLNRFVVLPGGSVAVAPQEATVAGVIVTPRDRCKFKPVRDARYEFTAGTLTKASAKEGDDCVQGNLTIYGAPMHRLGGLTIGLNPALEAVEDGGADYRPGAAAGMVTLSLGDNQFLGGATTVPGGVTVDLPVTQATVEIDGRKVIENGKLVGQTLAQR